MTTQKKVPHISSPPIKKVRSSASIISKIGQFLVGLLFLLSLFLLADYLLAHFQITTPPALLGIAVLFTGFVLTKCIPTPIELAAKPLLAHMSIFFIPAIVAIVSFIDLMAAFPLALLLAIVVSTIISLAITALLSQKLMYMLNPPLAQIEKASISTGKPK